MSIRTALTTVKSNFTKYLARGAGVAALGLIAYDSHIVGKLQSDVYSKSRDANAVMRSFNNTQYLSSPSMTTSHLKKGIFHWEVNNNFRTFINSAIGYFKGFGSMLVDNVIPLGLGLGALLGKNKWSKGSAIGLAIYGAVKICTDLLGFGHYSDLNKKF